MADLFFALLLLAKEWPYMFRLSPGHFPLHLLLEVKAGLDFFSLCRTFLPQVGFFFIRYSLYEGVEYGEGVEDVDDGEWNGVEGVEA